MFIDRIPLAKCNPNGVLASTGNEGFDFVRYAQYYELCKATDLSYEEHPATGTDNPAEARILAIVAINWTCRQNQAVPSSGRLIRVTEIGGSEPARPAGSPIHGVADVTQTRDTIAQNGEFAYVTSGRPNAFVEAPLEYFRLRQNTHIWHRVTGKITCVTDAQGMISATLEAKISDATKFPSHRVYEYRQDASGTPIFQRILADIPQQEFSNLWHLPPVGVP
jgi:hypothetical protein